MSISKRRAFVKGCSWEVSSNLVVFGLAFFAFGNVGACALFGGACFVVKLGLFVAHEKLWEG